MNQQRALVLSAPRLREASGEASKQAASQGEVGSGQGVKSVSSGVSHPEQRLAESRSGQWVKSASKQAASQGEVDQGMELGKGTYDGPIYKVANQDVKQQGDSEESHTESGSDVDDEEDRKPMTTSWGLSECNLPQVASPRKDVPKTVLFMLNRNGLDADELRTKFAQVLKAKYAADDVEVRWLSIFGKMPERPHAFITLSDEGVAAEILEDETITIELEGRMFHFELSAAFGLEPKDDEDPLCIYVSGIPADPVQEALEAKLLSYFSDIVPVAEVIFPREWRELHSVLLKFPNEECCSMVARTTRFCTFEGNVLSCRYARKQVIKPPRNPPKVDAKGFQQTKMRAPSSAPKSAASTAPKAPAKKPKKQAAKKPAASEQNSFAALKRR